MSNAENQEAPAAPQQVQIEVDDSHVIASYANFCRVTGSPEELIVDFGLNPQPMGVPKNPIGVSQRIILNYFTAKRLLAAHIPGARLELVADSGHATPIDQPDLFNRIVLQFIES